MQIPKNYGYYRAETYIAILKTFVFLFLFFFFYQRSITKSCSILIMLHFFYYLYRKDLPCIVLNSRRLLTIRLANKILHLHYYLLLIVFKQLKELLFHHVNAKKVLKNFQVIKCNEFCQEIPYITLDTSHIIANYFQISTVSCPEMVRYNSFK